MMKHDIFNKIKSFRCKVTRETFEQHYEIDIYQEWHFSNDVIQRILDTFRFFVVHFIQNKALYFVAKRQDLI